MDLCSIEDAFPNINTGSSPFPYVGGTDSKSSREERRAARKRAKKVKGPALAYSDSVAADLPDPDRLVGRLESVESVQGEKEGFKLPVLPKASCLFSDTGTPSYFGKDEHDGEEEGYSTYSATAGDNPNYMLQPDFTKTFDLKGVAKAGGQLPEPNLDQTWKPMSPAASYTAFVKETQPELSANTEQRTGPKLVNNEVPSAPAKDKNKYEDNTALMERINTLVGRLEQLEKKRAQDSQTEILAFVGTGLFLILAFDIFTRH